MPASRWMRRLHDARSKVSDAKRQLEPTVRIARKQAMVQRAALICIDGWGEREEKHGNAILEASTPVMDGFRDGDEANWAVIAAHGVQA